MVERVESPGNGENARCFRVGTDAGTTIESKVLDRRAGGGSFQPKKPPFPASRPSRTPAVFYSIPQDGALSRPSCGDCWGGRFRARLGPEPPPDRQADHAHPPSRRLPRRAPFGERDARAGRQLGRWTSCSARCTAVKGEAGNLSALVVRKESGDVVDLPCHDMLPFFGLTMKLGPSPIGGSTCTKTSSRPTRRRFETSTALGSAPLAISTPIQVSSSSSCAASRASLAAQKAH